MIRTGRSEIEASIDLPGVALAGKAAPAIEAACVLASKGPVNLLPVDHISLPEASADCPLVRS